MFLALKKDQILNLMAMGQHPPFYGFAAPTIEKEVNDCGLYQSHSFISYYAVS